MVLHVATGNEDTLGGERLLDAARWLERGTYHAWRIAHHLHLAERAANNDMEANEAAEREPPLPA